MQLKAVQRSFLFEGRQLADPDPELTPHEVAQRYAHQIPDLLQAEPLAPNAYGVIEFKKSYGTKG